MNILITNRELTQPSGTVGYVMDLALALKNRGYTVEVYTYKMGLSSDELKMTGINVVTRLSDLQHLPDIIHAHHFPCAVDVLRKLKKKPVIYFVHDRVSIYDRPFRNSNILKYVAVDYNCKDRFLENGIEEKFSSVVYNWVDIEKFKLRSEFSVKPTNALVFSNYATKENHFRIIADACEKAGLALDTMGAGMGNAVSNPQDRLLQYDVVFAKARAAMESIATGAAVIVCDYRGLGGMVTASNFDHFRKYNFGMKSLSLPIESGLLLEAIKKYDAHQNRLNAIRIREDASMEKTVDRLAALYTIAIREYAEGKRGPAGNYLLTGIRGFFTKQYFLFSYTILFRIFSRAKHRIKKIYN